MSDHKQSIEHHDHSANGHGINRTLTTVTLSPEQFESLYLAPRMPGKQYGLTKVFGNPSPLGITSFLLAHLPFAMDLLGFQGADASSAMAMLGSFYFSAGAGLYLACIMEWILGNTYPSVVFGTFGGFWITFGMLNQQTLGIAQSFAPAQDAGNGITATVAGQATVGYNTGLAMWFLVWAIINVIFMICAMRVNVPFFIIFAGLTFSFSFVTGAYFHSAQGNTALAATLFKIGGGFNFIVGLTGVYIDASLLLSCVGYPALPMYDLSTRFMVPKNAMEDRSKQV